MDLLLVQYSILIRRLREGHSSVKDEELKQLFDDIIVFIKDLTYTNKKSDGLDILTIVCGDLTSIHTLQLFNHPVIMNHPIFVYIGRTLEMLLTKSNHLKSIPMKKHEEDCFYSISFFITQLCLYRNEAIDLFYGSVSDEIFPVTGKINIRDETIDENSRKSNPIADKPNLKVSSLPSSAPKARPIEERDLDITKILHKRNNYHQLILSTDKTTTELSIFPPLPTDLPSKKYEEIFLTRSFLEKLVRSIEDLSQNEYSPYHVKYKVIDRLVRLCSKLNIVDILLDPIIKCLRSKLYRQIYATIETNQYHLNPKQLFFTYRCTQFIIENEFQRQEQIPNLLCQTMLEITKPIIDVILINNDDGDNSTKDGDRGMAHHALRYHLELLNYFSLTSSGRRYFLQSYIIDQMLSLLKNDLLISNEELFYAEVGIIANALMILYNLAYEQQFFSLLKRKNIQDICRNFQSSMNNTIQFALKTLLDIFNEDKIDEKNEPIKLKKAYVEYMQSHVIKSKQTKKLGVMKDIQEREAKLDHRFLTGSFLGRLSGDIEHLSITEYPPNVSKYKDVSRRIRVCTKQDTNEVESLLDPILKCLDSEFYLTVFDTIEVNETKAKSRAVLADSNLASKHLFFMRECPEFLFRHDYKRYNIIANSLGKKMLGYTSKIFEKHLPVLVEDQARRDVDPKRAARIKALSYHIKMLTHFTQTKTMRGEFLQTPIIDQILFILQIQSSGDDELGVIGQSLILLYNLVSENEIYSKLDKQNLLNICLKLNSSKDKLVHFTSQILLIILNKDAYDNIIKPDLLSKTCIEYIDRSVKEPKQLYQGIQLNNLLKNVEIIAQNSLFTQSLVGDEQGIPAITKCVHVNHPENLNLKKNKKTQKTAINIVWMISSYGPVVIKKLKENDLFIDQLLILLNETANKTKQTVNAIIWRLGSEETVRSEQTQKEANRKEKLDEILDDDQLHLTNEWDESIPYDVLISYCNNVNDKILSLRIYNRLIKKGYRVYCEKAGKHRLELMRKAVEKRKPILACLSKNYRSTKVCMAEIEYANKNLSPIIPVIVEPKFKIQGWLKHIIGSQIPIDFTGKTFDGSLLSLYVEVEKFKSSD